MGNLHCLDVGCGDASVINNDGATMLVDCHNIEDYVEHLPSGSGCVLSSLHISTRIIIRD